MSDKPSFFAELKRLSFYKLALDSVKFVGLVK